MTEFNWTQICDRNCLCSAFGLKCTYLCWCEGNSAHSTKEFDKNEFGKTENISGEDDDHYKGEGLHECEHEEGNDDWDSAPHMIF